MGRLAKQQACQLFIEQEIEKGLKEGKSKYAIGQQIAAWIKKVFEADVNPRTIFKRAERIATNIAIQPTVEDQTEKTGIQVSGPTHGGKRV
jgi:hypothetical protein